MQFLGGEALPVGFFRYLHMVEIHIEILERQGFQSIDVLHRRLTHDRRNLCLLPGDLAHRTMSLGVRPDVKIHRWGIRYRRTLRGRWVRRRSRRRRKEALAKEAVLVVAVLARQDRPYPLVENRFP